MSSNDNSSVVDLDSGGRVLGLVAVATLVELIADVGKAAGESLRREGRELLTDADRRLALVGDGKVDEAFDFQQLPHPPPEIQNLAANRLSEFMETELTQSIISQVELWFSRRSRKRRHDSLIARMPRASPMLQARLRLFQEYLSSAEMTGDDDDEMLGLDEPATPKTTFNSRSRQVQTPVASPRWANGICIDPSGEGSEGPRDDKESDDGMHADEEAWDMENSANVGEPLGDDGGMRSAPRLTTDETLGIRFGVTPGRRIILSTSDADHSTSSSQLTDTVVEHKINFPERVDDGMHSEDGGMHAEDGGMQAENDGMHAEDGAEDYGMHAEDGGMHTEDDCMHAEDGGMRAEVDGMHAEDDGMHAEDGGMHAKEGGVHAEDVNIVTDQSAADIITEEVCVPWCEPDHSDNHGMHTENVVPVLPPLAGFLLLDVIGRDSSDGPSPPIEMSTFDEFGTPNSPVDPDSPLIHRPPQIIKLQSFESKSDGRSKLPSSRILVDAGTPTKLAPPGTLSASGTPSRLVATGTPTRLAPPSSGTPTRLAPPSSSGTPTRLAPTSSSGTPTRLAPPGTASRLVASGTPTRLGLKPSTGTPVRLGHSGRLPNRPGPSTPKASPHRPDTSVVRSPFRHLVGTLLKSPHLAVDPAPQSIRTPCPAAIARQVDTGCIRQHRHLKPIGPKCMEDDILMSDDESIDGKGAPSRKRPAEAPWARKGQWKELVRQQRDIDPLTIFGLGCRPVQFEQVFNTPDFQRAAAEATRHNRPRVRDLTTTEGRQKLLRRWDCDKDQCGFQPHEGASVEQVQRFRHKTQRTRDVSNLVWESSWAACSEGCEHNSAIRQPWFQCYSDETTPGVGKVQPPKF